MFDNRKACLRERRLTSFRARAACEAVGKALKVGMVMAAVEYDTPYEWHVS
jgi:hypothetical protein